MGIPRRIDRYDVIAPLAKSASAIVYRARASAPLSPAGAPVPPASLPHVALKVLGDASAQLDDVADARATTRDLLAVDAQDAAPEVLELELVSDGRDPQLPAREQR